MTETTTFTTHVIEHFGFLVDDFQFQFSSPDPTHLKCAMYKAPFMDVEILAKEFIGGVEMYHRYLERFPTKRTIAVALSNKSWHRTATVPYAVQASLAGRNQQ